MSLKPEVRQLIDKGWAQERPILESSYLEVGLYNLKFNNLAEKKFVWVQKRQGNEVYTLKIARKC